MKKLFILAAAAVVALAACTKTEVVNDTPEQAISFQVANYVTATKANVVFADDHFNTYAWFHPDASSAAQSFMANETIKFQSNNTWAADRAYFWPKTGNVNFFSYAGEPAPTSVVENTVTYTDATIGIQQDALLASAAYHYGSANYDTNLYTDPILYNSVDTKGVPTLFHHLLSKVSFVVKFSAEGITDTNYKWDLVVNSASVEYASTGSLTVNFTDPGFTTTTQVWPYSAAGVQWTPKNVANVSVAAPATGVVDPVSGNVVTDADPIGDSGKQTVTATAAGDAISDGKTIIREITVLPQNITAATGTDAKFSINYTLTSYYNNAKHIEETVDLVDISLGDFVTAITEWDMNYKYIYNVVIKPNKTVTFDPAVVEWETGATATYTYPNN